MIIRGNLFFYQDPDDDNPGKNREGQQFLRAWYALSSDRGQLWWRDRMFEGGLLRGQKPIETKTLKDILKTYLS